MSILIRNKLTVTSKEKGAEPMNIEQPELRELLMTFTLDKVIPTPEEITCLCTLNAWKARNWGTCTDIFLEPSYILELPACINSGSEIKRRSDRELDNGFKRERERERELVRKRERELERELDREFDREFDRELVRKRERELERDLDREFDREFDREADSGSWREINMLEEEGRFLSLESPPMPVIRKLQADYRAHDFWLQFGQGNGWDGVMQPDGIVRRFACASP
jgi:hypothetical protein